MSNWGPLLLYQSPELHNIWNVADTVATGAVVIVPRIQPGIVRDHGSIRGTKYCRSSTCR